MNIDSMLEFLTNKDNILKFLYDNVSVVVAVSGTVIAAIILINKTKASKFSKNSKNNLRYLIINHKKLQKQVNEESKKRFF